MIIVLTISCTGRAGGTFFRRFVFVPSSGTVFKFSSSLIARPPAGELVVMRKSWMIKRIDNFQKLEQRNKKVDVLFFDLDGTLIDTD